MEQEQILKATIIASVEGANATINPKLKAEKERLIAEQRRKE